MEPLSRICVLDTPHSLKMAAQIANCSLGAKKWGPKLRISSLTAEYTWPQPTSYFVIRDSQPLVLQIYRYYRAGGPLGSMCLCFRSTLRHGMFLQRS